MNDDRLVIRLGQPPDVALRVCNHEVRLERKVHRCPTCRHDGHAERDDGYKRDVRNVPSDTIDSRLLQLFHLVTGPGVVGSQDRSDASR